MRINRFVALSTGTSRRRADELIAQGKVQVNGRLASPGQDIGTQDQVIVGVISISAPQQPTTIMLNKPVGYVCSRAGQGNKTIYDILPLELNNLKPAGRLDKDSSGLLLLTDDGQLANKLTHPSFEKEKVYEVVLDKPLTDSDQHKIKQGVTIETYVSRLRLQKLATDKHLVSNSYFLVTLTEGKNRQIRRTFLALGYNVLKLHRTTVGQYQLGNLTSGKYRVL